MSHGEALVRRLAVGAHLRVGVSRLLLGVRRPLLRRLHAVARLRLRPRRLGACFSPLGQVRGCFHLVGDCGGAGFGSPALVGFRVGRVLQRRQPGGRRLLVGCETTLTRGFRLLRHLARRRLGVLFAGGALLPLVDRPRDALVNLRRPPVRAAAVLAVGQGIAAVEGGLEVGEVVVGPVRKVLTQRLGRVDDEGLLAVAVAGDVPVDPVARRGLGTCDRQQGQCQGGEASKRAHEPSRGRRGHGHVSGSGCGRSPAEYPKMG